VGALAGLVVAHGGIPGAVVELLVGLAVVALFGAVWLRERRVREGGEPEGAARLRDEDEPPA
jgi:hypothetical protein